MLRKHIGISCLLLGTSLSGCVATERPAPPAELYAPGAEEAPPPPDPVVETQPPEVVEASPADAVAEANAGNGGRTNNANNAAIPMMLLTPATRISRGTEAVNIPSGTYTRLKITSQNGSAGSTGGSDLEIFPYRARSPIERFFVGTKHSVTLTANVASGTFVATVPLLTVTHDSTRAKGEEFNRTIRQQALDFPMFLVTGNASSDVVAVTFTLKGTDKIESSGAATALSTVIAAAKVLSPTPALLTKLSSDTSKSLATTLDSTINSLFGQSLQEVHGADQSIRTWTPWKLRLRLPRKEGRWNARKTAPGSSGGGSAEVVRENDLDFGEVGTWTVTFETPRISAFSAATVSCSTNEYHQDCRAAVEAAKVAATADLSGRFGSVLNFELFADGQEVGKLGSYLRQLAWWTEAVNAMGATDATAAGKAVTEFCRRLRGAVAGLGFNDLDAGFVLQAVRLSDLVSADAGQLMRANTSCQVAEVG